MNRWGFSEIAGEIEPQDQIATSIQHPIDNLINSFVFHLRNRLVTWD